MTVKGLTQFLGKIAMFLYIISYFITASGLFPQILLSVSLYFFAGMGIISLLIQSKINSRYLIWYFLFIVVSIIGIIYCPGKDWGDTLYKMIVVLVLALAFTQFVNEKKDFDFVVYSYVIGALLLFFILLFTDRLHEDDRLGTTAMGNANIFASYFMMAGVLAIWLLVHSNKKSEKLFLLISTIIIFYALLLSGGRKFVVVPVVFLYILLLLKKDKKGRNHTIIYTLIIIGIVWFGYGLIMHNEILYDSIGQRMEGLINSFIGGETDFSTEMREKMRTVAFIRGWESPFWGHGFDSFKYLAQEELNFYAYSHNNWTEMWYNHGLLGLVAYYSYYVIMLRAFIKLRRKSMALSSFGIATIIAVFIFEYGAVSYVLIPIQILLCLVAVAYNIERKEKRLDDGKN